MTIDLAGSWRASPRAAVCSEHASTLALGYAGGFASLCRTKNEAGESQLSFETLGFDSKWEASANAITLRSPLIDGRGFSMASMGEDSAMVAFSDVWLDELYARRVRAMLVRRSTPSELAFEGTEPEPYDGLRLIADEDKGPKDSDPDDSQDTSGVQESTQTDRRPEFPSEGCGCTAPGVRRTATSLLAALRVLV